MRARERQNLTGTDLENVDREEREADERIAKQTDGERVENSGRRRDGRAENDAKVAAVHVMGRSGGAMKQRQSTYTRH